jgi:DNA polymerase III epsilon subunit-like protein
VHPRDALDRFVAERGDLPLVAHNGWGFDYPMLGLLHAAHGVPFAPAHTDLMDTCMTARAALAGVTPLPHEDYRKYVRRLERTRCGKHALRDCVSDYDLDAAGVDPRHGHDAEYDAWVCHVLFERFRALARSRTP